MWGGRGRAGKGGVNIGGLSFVSDGVFQVGEDKGKKNGSDDAEETPKDEGAAPMEDDAPAKPSKPRRHVAPDREFGSHAKTSGGVGMSMMMMLGFNPKVPRLGKNQDGIVNPIKAVKRPANVGLGGCEADTLFAKLNKELAGDAAAASASEDDQEDELGLGPVGPSGDWKQRRTPRRKRVYKTAEDFLKEYGGGVPMDADEDDVVVDLTGNATSLRSAVQAQATRRTALTGKVDVGGVGDPLMRTREQAARRLAMRKLDDRSTASATSGWVFGEDSQTAETPGQRVLPELRHNIRLLLERTEARLVTLSRRAQSESQTHQALQDQLVRAKSRIQTHQRSSDRLQWCISLIKQARGWKRRCFELWQASPTTRPPQLSALRVPPPTLILTHVCLPLWAAVWAQFGDVCARHEILQRLWESMVLPQLKGLVASWNLPFLGPAPPRRLDADGRLTTPHHVVMYHLLLWKVLLTGCTADASSQPYRALLKPLAGWARQVFQFPSLKPAPGWTGTSLHAPSNDSKTSAQDDNDDVVLVMEDDDESKTPASPEETRDMYIPGGLTGGARYGDLWEWVIQPRIAQALRDWKPLRHTDTLDQDGNTAPTPPLLTFLTELCWLAPAGTHTRTVALAAHVLRSYVGLAVHNPDHTGGSDSPKPVCVCNRQQYPFQEWKERGASGRETAPVVRSTQFMQPASPSRSAAAALCAHQALASSLFDPNSSTDVRALALVNGPPAAAVQFVAEQFSDALGSILTSTLQRAVPSAGRHDDPAPFHLLACWLTHLQKRHTASLLSLDWGVRLFLKQFFGRWLDVLTRWLMSGESDMKSVGRWYVRWRRLLPACLLTHTEVQPIMRVALDLMKTGMERHRQQTLSADEYTVKLSNLQSAGNQLIHKTLAEVEARISAATRRTQPQTTAAQEKRGGVLAGLRAAAAARKPQSSAPPDTDSLTAETVRDALTRLAPMLQMEFTPCFEQKHMRGNQVYFLGQSNDKGQAVRGLQLYVDRDAAIYTRPPPSLEKGEWTARSLQQVMDAVKNTQ